MARILVTGGSGLLGQYLAAEALARGYDVAGTYATQPFHRDEVVAVYMDLGHPDSVESAFAATKADLIVHAAAMTDVDACERDPARARAVNVEGTRNVAQAARDRGADLCVVSTDYVFDGSAAPYAEDAEPKPMGIYGRTKYEGEMAAKAVHPEATILRVSALFGWNRISGKLNSVTWILDRLRKGHPVPLFTDQWVSPTFAETAATAAIALRGRPGTYHVACGECVNRVELGRRIADVFDLDESNIQEVSMEDAHLAAPRPRHVCLLVKRVEQTLNAVMPGVRHALERMRETE